MHSDGAQRRRVDIRDIVLSNSTFGPREISQLTQAIAEDYQQFGVLRDAVAELEVREDRTPGRGGAPGRLLLPAGPLSPGDRNAAHGRRRRAGPLLHRQEPVRPGPLCRGDQGVRRGQDGRLQRRRLCPGHRRSPSLRQGPEEGPGSARQAVRRRRADRRIPVSARRHRRGPRRQARRKSSPSSSGPSKSMAGMPAPCSAWRSKTIAAATTKRRCSFISGPPATFPANVGTLINLGILYEDRQQFDRAQLCYQRVLDVYPDHPRARLYVKDASASGNILFDEEAQRRQDRLAAGAQHSGHRFRALGPQPQLPAEDGRSHAGRSDAHERAGAAGQQELWRDVAGRNSRHAAFQGAGAGSVRRPKRPSRRAGGRSGDDVARRAGHARAADLPI